MPLCFSSRQAICVGMYVPLRCAVQAVLRVGERVGTELPGRCYHRQLHDILHAAGHSARRRQLLCLGRQQHHVWHHPIGARWCRRGGQLSAVPDSPTRGTDAEKSRRGWWLVVTRWRLRLSSRSSWRALHAMLACVPKLKWGCSAHAVPQDRAGALAPCVATSGGVACMNCVRYSAVLYVYGVCVCRGGASCALAICVSRV